MASAHQEGNGESFSFAEALSRTMANVDLAPRKAGEAASLRLTADLRNDLRAVMYGLGVLVAAADGIIAEQGAHERDKKEDFFVGLGPASVVRGVRCRCAPEPDGTIRR